MITKTDNNQLQPSSKTRNSGVELLRLLAIIGVVFIHVSDRAIPALEATNVVGSLHLVLFLRSLFSSSVDLFLIISGFFMVKSNVRHIGKPIDLLLQVSFFQGFYYFILELMGLEPLSLIRVFYAAIPDCYYATLFIVLYLVSPYINKIINGLSQKELKRFIFVVILLFSVFSVISTLFNEITNTKWMGLNTIGAWGSQQGFNIVNFTLCYCMGAFIRLYLLPEKLLKTNLLVLLLVISTVMIFGWAEVNQQMTRFGMRSAWVYDNPFVLLQGVTLFLLSRKLLFTSKLINSMAKIVFAMFIIHCILIKYFDIELLCNRQWYLLIGGYLLFVICSFIISFIAFYLYRGLFKPLLDRLNQKTIYYFD